LKSQRFELFQSTATEGSFPVLFIFIQSGAESLTCIGKNNNGDVNVNSDVMRKQTTHIIYNIARFNDPTNRMQTGSTIHRVFIPKA